MRHFIGLMVAVLFVAFSSLVIFFDLFPAQPLRKGSDNIITEKQASPTSSPAELVRQLSTLQGRAAGTNAEKKAATLIAAKFLQLNLESLPSEDNNYWQEFKVPKRTSYVDNGRLRFKGTGPAKYPSQNVLGFWPGKSKQTLIISAHYDGQGINGRQIYPSCNDNLSGIYGLVSLAEQITARPTSKISYLFIGFGAEEMGLYGSEYFTPNLPIPREQIIGVINLDTISTTSRNILIEATDSSALVATVAKALQEYDYSVSYNIGNNRTSDHFPFSLKKINALTVMAGDWLVNNHTPADTFEQLYFKNMNGLVKAILEAIFTIEEQTTL